MFHCVILIHRFLYWQVESNKINNTSVLVFMHGGSNRVGMGSMLEGDILAGHGAIIVVTFNYRLGIYGEHWGVMGSK
jgi:neuroligin